jgi:hypothetical protein
MTRPPPKKCIDCGGKMKSRRKTTKRCRVCHLKAPSERVKMGWPKCADCGAELSTRKNASGRCKKCLPNYMRGIKRPRPESYVPWNKGLITVTKEERLQRRRELRINESEQSRIADRIRTLIRNSLRRDGKRKTTKTAELLGCSPAEFAKHLESQFKPGMNWQNYGNRAGDWNIDHVIPISAFDLSDVEQQKKAFHYSNCRPLCAIENMKKGRKLPAADVNPTLMDPK